MLTLAIETTSRAASLALFERNTCLAHERIGPELRTAQALAPAIRDLAAAADRPLAKLRLIAVAAGPGSFTGLRIGVTTAKALAYALRADVLAVNTLDAIAHRAPEEVEHLAVVLPAERGQFYAASYRRDDEHDLARDGDVRILDPMPWADALPTGSHVSGPALAKLRPTLPDHIRPLDESLWHATAESVGKLALHRYDGGERHDLWTLAPEYVRLPAAEEKRRSQN